MAGANLLLLGPCGSLLFSMVHEKASWYFQGALVSSWSIPISLPSKGVHGRGVQMPRDCPQNSLIQARDFSADFIGCAHPCPAVQAAGRRGLGFPGARWHWSCARDWSTHTAVAPPLPHHLLLSGLCVQLPVADEGCWRQRFIQRSVFPRPEHAGCDICTDVLSSARLQKQLLGCLLPTGPGCCCSTSPNTCPASLLSPPWLAGGMGLAQG